MNSRGSEQGLDKLAEGPHLKRVQNFMKWAENRRKLAPHDPVLSNLLECHNPASMNMFVHACC